jgi:hypothetical protein
MTMAAQRNVTLEQKATNLVDCRRSSHHLLSRFEDCGAPFAEVSGASWPPLY